MAYLDQDQWSFAQERPDSMNTGSRMSVVDTPGDPSPPGVDEQEATLRKLKSYLNSVPYDCEPPEDMHEALEKIVGMLAICIKSRSWNNLSSWDGLLQCWMLLRYPLSKSIRAKLVKLYFELCLVPGIDARTIRSWADMLSRILGKSSVKPKLSPEDLQLPWKPLWLCLKKEIWPQERTQDPKYSILTIVPVMTSFLPRRHIEQYMPLVFKLWEAFNSSVLDDRFLELASELSERHVAGSAGPEGGAPWKDIGIWTEDEWNLLIGKGFGSLNVPVGTGKFTLATSTHADILTRPSRIKKTISRPNALAKLLVYSMAVDGPVRPPTPVRGAQQQGYPAGCKALETLERLVTCTETFFHPSNTGPWTPVLATLLHHLTTEFIQRWKEEELPECDTPVGQRLTPAIRKSFVQILRTPALLGMFSKDSGSMSHAQGALRTMALLEPGIIMPELLERAYSGLEVVNETHRTTAVLSMLSGMAVPLVSPTIWPPAVRHLVPLLELSVPGIDLNDPAKTVTAALFIVSVVQHIKIGDLSGQHSGSVNPLVGDGPADGMMDVDIVELPEGTEPGDTPSFSLEEERSLVRDSTANFADWVTSLLRRVLSLFENLPEEGGRGNTTGGKSEESVIKSVKSMMDIVALHLSDELFDLVLRIVHEYGVTNAKSNAVRAFGQLVASLARAHPNKTIKKFFAHCSEQIVEELKHGASSVRTTSSHAAVPSDTTLHWNISILRGCLGYGGPAMLPYRKDIVQLLKVLIDRTFSERGYTGTGRLISRILHTVSAVYPYDSRFVNQDLWDSEEFERNHDQYWGKSYEVEDVKLDWHVPTAEEIDFVLEIIDEIAVPTMARLEALLDKPHWDSADRNDFCRYLIAVRSVWSGLPTFLKEQPKTVPNPCILEDMESMDLIVKPIEVEAGFTLSDPKDPRYQKAAAARERFGELCARASTVLKQNKEGEDHIDAMLGVVSAMDVYLLDYGILRRSFDSLEKNFVQARNVNRSWPKERKNSRVVFVKRAHVYHSGRVYLNSLYRRRSALDDKVLLELVQLSLSPYTRIRRHAQSVLHSAFGYFVRSTRIALGPLFDALGRGNDPDRMKGALYSLSNKSTAAFAFIDPVYYPKFILSLLDCQHEEKPSVQKLVTQIASDFLPYISEEVTPAWDVCDVLGVDGAVNELVSEFSPGCVDEGLGRLAHEKAGGRVKRWQKAHGELVTSILGIAGKPTTHWRYVLLAARFLFNLIRRDVPTAPELAAFFARETLSPQPTIRTVAQRGIIRCATFVKMRTYCASREALWMEDVRNPLTTQIPVKDPKVLLRDLQVPLEQFSENSYFVDKLDTGFLLWTPTVKAYKPILDPKYIPQWEEASQPCLQAIRDVVTAKDYLSKLAALWSQESSRTNVLTEFRSDNFSYIRSIAKVLQHAFLDNFFDVVDPLITDADKFKQRAGAEMLSGLLRGSKNWPLPITNRIWDWVLARMDKIFAQIKPDTVITWETLISFQLSDCDPRRHGRLIQWILDLPLEFNGDSAFQMSKSLSMFGILVASLGVRSNPWADKYVELFFQNSGTAYAEIRNHLTQTLYSFMKNQWQPYHPSIHALLESCRIQQDPLQTRNAGFMPYIQAILDKLPQWRQERLPPPRTSLSEYDRVSLTLLSWAWIVAHSSNAPLLYPYAVSMMPEIISMAELQDNPELQRYSNAVLFVLAGNVPPAEQVEIILDNFVTAIKSSTSWRIRQSAMPTLVVYFYRNMMAISPAGVKRTMSAVLDCLADENVEVREMASKALSGIVRSSQRQSIIPLKNRFITLAKATDLPSRQDPGYADALRKLHSAILGLCALIQSAPYTVEPWMPPLTDVLASHATDPPPISTTIRKTAGDFKKTHQDTWHTDQKAFDEDQLQNLSTMLVGTSYSFFCVSTEWQDQVGHEGRARREVGDVVELSVERKQRYDPM
ncbi:hypothetical protein GGG16DRAFT_125867 [Schizophyllum commune]